jgi:septal ring factor EnvC (AmiA/AmiB activator)
MDDFKDVAHRTVVELFDLAKEQQAEIKQLKAQLNNMEQCYIQIKQEHNELIAFNTEIDRKQKVAEKTAKKYMRKVSMIADLLRNPLDREMTLKAITTVIERVGE